jgi:hypothetical protein
MLSVAACLLLHLLLLTPSHAQLPPFTRWTISTNDWVTASPVIGPDGAVHVGSWDCTMYNIGTSGPTEGQVPACLLPLRFSPPSLTSPRC